MFRNFLNSTGFMRSVLSVAKKSAPPRSQTPLFTPSYSFRRNVYTPDSTLVGFYKHDEGKLLRETLRKLHDTTPLQLNSKEFDLSKLIFQRLAAYIPTKPDIFSSGEKSRSFQLQLQLAACEDFLALQIVVDRNRAFLNKFVGLPSQANFNHVLNLLSSEHEENLQQPAATEKPRQRNYRR